MSDGPLIVIFVILKLWVVKFYTTKFCQCANIIFDKKIQSQGDDIKISKYLMIKYGFTNGSFQKLFCTTLNSKVKVKWKYVQVNFLLYSIIKLVFISGCTSKKIKLEISILFYSSLSNHEKRRHLPFMSS